MAEIRGERTKGLRDYLDLLKRRKLQILIPMGVILSVAACVAFLLPPVYRSSATILIEEQEIPQDLVRSTVTSYADQRIETIKHQVMTRSNLWRIVEQYDLYRGMRQRRTTEEVLERLVDDISVNVISADVIDQRTDRPMRATIAFTLSYHGESPQVTQKVANELTDLFLSENLRTRERSAQETTSFLRREAGNLDGHIRQLENRISAFKQKADGALPELIQINMQLMEQTHRELRDVERQTRMEEDRKIYLEGQLATLKPGTPILTTGGERILDSGERLKALRAQYASSSGYLLPDHPDMVKMKREIQALEKAAGDRSGAEDIYKELVNERSRLTELMERYGENHPDVVRSQHVTASLEQELQQDSRISENQRSIPPENPAYIMIQSQLASAQNALDAGQKMRESLQGRLKQYAERVERTPMIEQVYQDLVRDRDNSIHKYHEIRSKLLEAQVAEGMEIQRKGERFSLIDPPALPEKPEKPNRAALLFLGVVLGAVGGVGYGAALESMDHSVRLPNDLLRIAHAPPLAVIPYRPNTEDRRQRTRRRKMLIRGAVGFMILLPALVHFLWIPLDVVWFFLLRRFGI